MSENNKQVTSIMRRTLMVAKDQRPHIKDWEMYLQKKLNSHFKHLKTMANKTDEQRQQERIISKREERIARVSFQRTSTNSVLLTYRDHKKLARRDANYDKHEQSLLTIYRQDAVQLLQSEYMSEEETDTEKPETVKEQWVIKRPSWRSSRVSEKKRCSVITSLLTVVSWLMSS